MRPLNRFFTGLAAVSSVISVSCALGQPAAAADKLTHVVLAVVPTIASGSTYIADSKGYFKDEGIDAEIQTIQSVSTAMPLLAAGKAQVAQGGLAAAFWNGVSQGLPVIMAFEGGSTPLNHHILLNNSVKDKIKTVADLKGH